MSARKAKVVFGDWLIFDAFPSHDDAEAFAEAVRLDTGRETAIYVDAEAAASEAVYPLPLIAPVVLVRRHHSFAGELPLEPLAERFGGEFAGT